MLCFQLPTICSVSRRLISPLPNSHHSDVNSFSAFKLCRTCFSSNPKSRLAGVSASAADAGIQLPRGLRQDLMPKHVAFIIDGHGRWAKSRGLTVEDGHKVGSKNYKDLVSNSCKLGIKILTLYTFSTENWNRSKVEVDHLLRCFEDFIRSDIPELITRHEIRFTAIGNKSRLPESLQSAISSAEKVSHANKGMHFVMAISYSGQNDIVEATKEIARQVEDGMIRANDVDAALFERQLMTRSTEYPSPDLLIRAGGELRLSNFLLWQVAYTELYFTKTKFPDFGEEDLLEAIVAYQCRERGYGERRNQDMN